MKRRLKDDLRWGVDWGLKMAAVYCVFAAALAIGQRSIQFPAYKTNLFWLCLAYVCAGVIAGLLIGLFRPWSKRALGRAIIGAAVAIPVSLTLFPFVAGPPGSWSVGDWVFIFVFAVFVGPFFGLATMAEHK
jgi:hypothetical protein